MTPRRPSSASNDAGPSRMPFASAEKLLYGPEMQQQHAYLLTEMRALQRQHEAYDARIQSTEAAAVTAEAATSRIRHMEQRLAAIEAEDDDKAFEKWAAGEMTRLSIFVDTNKNVRQKQIELDKEVSVLGEDLDKLRDVPVDLKGLVRRFELLEANRKEDAHRISSLEREFVGLKSMRPYSGKDSISPRAHSMRREEANEAITPAQRQDAEISDATTEDEDLVPRSKPIREHMQVPQNPETRGMSSETILSSSPTKAEPVISARHRLLKRPSIHNTMLPRLMEERQPQAPTAVSTSRPRQTPNPPATQLVDREKEYRSSRPGPEPRTHPIPTSIAPATQSVSQDGAPVPEIQPHSHTTPSLPATQLVDREKQRRAPARGTGRRPRQTPNAPAVLSKASPRKRKRPDEEPLTQRVTRSQAKKNQENMTIEQAEAPIPGHVTSIEPTQLVDRGSSPHKKPKPTPLQQPMNILSGPNRAIPTSPKKTKKPNMIAPQPNEIRPAETTQPMTGSTRKANKPNALPLLNKNTAPKAARAPASPAKKKQLIVVLPNPKAGPQTYKDDELLMDNGNGFLPVNAADRVKMSPRKAANLSPQKVLSKPKNYSKKKLHSDAGGGSTDYNESADVDEDYIR